MIRSVSPKLRIGLRIDPRLPSSGGEAGERLAALLEAAPTIEASGFDVLWVAERPTSHEALLPSALVLCAALAARTQTLRIATGLLPLPLYHPFRIAEDAAVVDGLSDGRFELGVGLGSDPDALARFGVDAEERAERFEEALEMVQRAWAGGPVEFEGRHFASEGLEVHPQPVQPGGPPLWIGATAPAAQRRAASRQSGLMLRVDASPEPYLETWRREHAGSSSAVPRLAWLLGTGDELVPPGEPLADAGPLELDAVLPLPADLSAAELGPAIGDLADRAGQIRRSFG
ncbi:MAG: hypothetical protein CL910_04010 [Deltaproteobacteria bacterium]|jgi:alkanesulfonate monooxygenase SsuD/methylene tetrahydromethanopterin reductase-like flavin-dependent oxidoreductase (luciferase family)|nr:hypothetical protein [Deltaproteobacteria bacterium]